MPGDVRSEFAGDFESFATELTTCLLHPGQRCLDGRGEALALFLTSVRRVKALTGVSLVADHVFDRLAVFALESFDLVDAVLDPGELCGINFEATCVVAQRVLQFFDFHAGGIEPGDTIAHSRVHFFEFTDATLGIGQAGDGGAKQVDGLRCVFEQAAAVLRLAIALFDLVDFLDIKFGGRDFLDLKAEQVNFLFTDVAGILKLIEFEDGLLPSSESLAIGLAFIAGVGIGIEHGELTVA